MKKEEPEVMKKEEPMKKEELMATSGITQSPPLVPTLMPMAEVIQNLLDKIEEAMEEQLGTMDNIRAVGGPYESSLLAVQKKKLSSAAAAVLATIVNDPAFRQVTN